MSCLEGAAEIDGTSEYDADGAEVSRETAGKSLYPLDFRDHRRDRCQDPYAKLA